MTTQTTIKRSNRAESILDVAEDVFARYGYLAARVNDIASEANIRRPSLFHHFPNKQALFVAVMNRAMERQLEYFQNNLPVKPPESPILALEQILDATFNFLVDHPNIAYLSLHILANNRVDELPTNISEISLDRWKTILEWGRKEGVFRDVSLAECTALYGGMTIFYITLYESRTRKLKEIRNVERNRIREDLQRAIKALVLLPDSE